MSRQLREQQAATVLDEARFCAQVGYFKGALDRALQLRNHPKFGLSARHVEWIAHVYLGEDHWADAMKMREVIAEFMTLYGGQGVAECVCLIQASYADAAAEGIQHIFRVADAQHGVFVTWHPTAILWLAELALAKLGDLRSAVLLTSMALGFRGVFVSLADVHRLAKLLIALNAPVCLWADWCNVLIQHIHVASARTAFLHKKLRTPGESERWSLAEDAASEEMVKSVLAAAPSEVWALLCSLAPHLDATELGKVINDRFSPNSVAGRRGAESVWSEPVALRYRYFWYDMMDSAQQDLTRNGDWAMFGLPTDDFSMALAQWWRALESVLKQTVVNQLSSAFAQQPQLIAWDRENLSLKRQKEEAVFLDKLAVPERAAKITLYDILLILKKCEMTNDHGVAASRSRLEAAQILKRYSTQIGPLTKGTWLHPAHLTDENINWFRNRSAHDASVTLIDGAIGRVLSKRILSGFFAPLLERWGFKAALL